ncbi:MULTISPECIES: TlpA family protein disulfide reductase [Sphingobacterium]|uniref:TlpA family protein disulfide reductase n=1 Tax=Sphingobacterium TaxID=28453 RepID=UPI0013DC8707|nr:MULTISPECIES: TlpA disulfide reductase family protein [unclassified Sphingobacterium]
MKKTFLTVTAALSSAALFAQSPVQVKGTLEKESVSVVKLFKVVNGDMEEIASAIPQADKKFGFTFYPDYEGFYALGTGELNSPTDNLTFYFKSGDELELTIKEMSYDLIGTGNSPENKILSNWHKLVNPIEDKAFSWRQIRSTFLDFYPQLDSVNQETKRFVKTNKSGNPRFDNRFETYIKWDIAAIAVNFMMTPRSVHPTIEEYSDYYKTLSLADFSKDAFVVYNLPWGNRTLSSVSSIFRRINNTPPGKGISGLQKDTELLSNDTLKGDVVLKYLAQQKDYKLYKEAADKYKGFLLTDAQKTKASSIMNNIAPLKVGEQGLDFSFPDKNGKVVRFSDLRGKVVLIDVWATWCGPCKAEIPHLKKLEEEMNGTDLEIVSISVDEDKDKEKWLKMIKDEKLGGIQLFASGWGGIAEYYKINGIPRFMVFDRSGNIVTIDSPRPSKPALKELLERVLSEKK